MKVRSEQECFKTILSSRRPSEYTQEFSKIIEKFIDIACRHSDCSMRGLRLAAVFDLLASAEYYESVTNRGWTYCNLNPYALFYPYTNTCPRCVGNLQFEFTSGNKPTSAQIGVVTAGLLCKMLEIVFNRNGGDVEVRQASEPIDAVIYDKKQKRFVLAEVKSAPLLTLPLIMQCDEMTELNSNGEINFVSHSVADNPLIRSAKLGLYIPKTKALPERIFPLEIDWNEQKPFFHAIDRLQEHFFDIYFEYWKLAYEGYKIKDESVSLFWLTNGCGQPRPRPQNWPSRKGVGFESISDGKTSVGMDRTDDIKKAIYQVLKLGAEYKPFCKGIKTAIISNMHAIRHYEEYLSTMQNVIWALCDQVGIERASQLKQETPIYNLFDGILSFTESKIHDAWLKDLYQF